MYKNSPIIYVLFLLTAIGSSWGACSSYINSFTTQYVYYSDESCSEVCSGSISCPSTRPLSSGYLTSIRLNKISSCQSSYWTPCNSSILTGREVYNCIAELFCDTQAEADSVACELDGGTWDGSSCDIRKTFGCETITGAGGSQWSQIDSMGTKKGTFVGSCADNGYCQSGETSCSYDSISCKYNGKNGSQCYYQCSDGNALKCNSSPSLSVSTGGTPQTYCPSVPDSSCAPNTFKEFNNPSYMGGGLGDSSSADSIPVGESPFGGADYSLILNAIHDTLHTANNLYRSQNFYQWEIDSILSYWGYNYIPEFLDNQEDIIYSINNKNLSVEIPVDSVKNQKDSVYQDSSLSLLDKIKNIPERINFIADSLYNDCLASQTNCKRSMIGATMEALNFLNPISQGIEIIKDFFADNDTITAPVMSVDSLPNFENPLDTNFEDIDTSFIDINQQNIFKWLDTVPNLLPNIDSVKLEIDSAKKVIEDSQDSSNSVVNVDSLGSSFSDIKSDTKYSFIWMSEACGSCYRINFTLSPEFMAPDKIHFDLDLGNFWGINVCTIVKEIVLLIGFVIVLLITIKSFKSAWEGGK